MPLTSTKSADVFLHVPRDVSIPTDRPSRRAGAPSRSKPTKTVTLVFFIPGNPGLISYYHPFLDLLAKRLGKRQRQDRWQDRQAVITAGLSLGGFDVAKNGGDHDDDHDDDQSAAEEKKKKMRELMYPSRGSHRGIDDGGGGANNNKSNNNRIYSLKDQIELCYARVQSLCDMIREEYHGRLDEGEKGSTGPDGVKVILVGHSVGTYICLEMVRLWHERRLPKKEHGSSKHEREEPPWTMSNCILLTPTIVDLHSSASGRIATPLLTSVPFVSGCVPGLAQLLVHAVVVKSVLPAHWLRGFVKKVTGMEEGGHGLDSTMAFLESQSGVRQALSMAADELREIRADRWGDEVWGAAVDEDEGDATTSTTPRDEGERNENAENRKCPPRMYLWFAKEDHWIADMTRTDILRNRGQRATGQQRGPTIVIDETEGLVHAWCLEQSEMVAAQVGRWLEEIME
ncbi:uncharacterized protein PV06_09452 [Exophiala oligosperma]|uniref:AB hydrolase-1 domain-containing protein n=1 Tax=Exophiala oligosperma TaxID=215243 RepID=A0A0D2AEE2_9EURO|nr:uncharacterized protein PV06_09452 [Exophiala oligosperma]KIW38496.1 hypothetical protein PV06_09452 [Exophiala oligosperma]